MTLQVQSILRSLFEDDPLPTSECGPCQDQLPAFVDMELAGGDAAAVFPSVRAHLPHCTTCGPLYDELKALLALEQSDELARPPVAASFDFNYLPAPAARRPTEARQADRPWRLDALGRLIIEFSSELLRSLQGPTLQPSYLKSDSPQLLTYTLAGAVEDLDVRISAEPAHNDPDHYHVEVEVEIPSRGGWPNLAGSVVALSVENEEFDRQETDAFGKALFEDVSADALPLLSVLIEAEH